MAEKYLTALCTLLNRPPLPDDLRVVFMNYSQEDWEQFLDLAGKHNLIPLVFARLKSLGLSHTIPTAIIEKMRQAMLTNATRNAIFLHEAKTIIEALQEANIPVIGLKGLYLLENIYPDISTRTMNDLDLMVKKADIPVALSICQDLGYQPTTYFGINDPNLDIKHVPPLKKEPGPYLELHWTILEEDEPFTIDANGLWERTVTAKLAGVEALSLSPEDLILHLCLHLSYQHHFNIGLRGLYDIAAVLRHFEGQVDWQKLIAIAQAWGATRVLWLTLTLVDDIFTEKVPEEVISQIQPTPIDPLILEHSRVQLLSMGLGTQTITPDLAKFTQEGSFLERIKLIWRRIFLPKRTLARLYNVPPTSLRIYSCYFKRARDLFKQYRTSINSILAQDTATLTNVENQIINQRLRAWMGEK